MCVYIKSKGHRNLHAPEVLYEYNQWTLVIWANMSLQNAQTTDRQIHNSKSKEIPEK